MAELIPLEEINKLVSKGKSLWKQRQRKIIYTNEISRAENALFVDDNQLAELVMKKVQAENEIEEYVENKLKNHREEQGLNTGDLLEELAALEHEQWMVWSKGVAKNISELVDLCEEKCCWNGTKYPAITEAKERLERWESLWIPYEELSEEMKESDRVYAERVLKCRGV